MRLGTKIIIVGFTLFTVGIIGIELSAQSLSSEPRNQSDIPLWIRLVNDMPTYLVFVGIITTIAGFIIRRKQYTGGMRDMRK
jgi:hypothetical protein